MLWKSCKSYAPRYNIGGISNLAKRAGQHFIIVSADHILDSWSKSEEAKYLLALAIFKLSKKQRRLDNPK